MSNDIVYVFGHINPDTDSIASAIAYANLKRKLNINAYACRLGAINQETKYILNRLNFPEPMLLEDARSCLDEIAVDEAVKVLPDATILEVLEKMEIHDKQVVAVVNQLDKLQGIITKSNIATISMGDTSESIELFKKTPIEYFARVIKGKLIYAPEQARLNGKVSCIALSSNRLTNYDLTDRIVIIGNDVDAQLEAIEKGAACIITVWTDNIAPMVIEKAVEKNCGIIISGYGMMNTSRYLYFAPPAKYIMTSDLEVFRKREYVKDVAKKITYSRYRSYPVVDNQNHIFGFISRYHVLNAKNRSVILLDHNEPGQSVRFIEQAEIKEIIDHHRISDLMTSKPIYFRNEVLGSTATIVAKMYYEHGVEIEEKYAALLLSAIISDTLNFKSPTTTAVDRKIANQLAEIANLDIDEFAYDIFMASNEITQKSISELIKYDMKEFVISNRKINISQIILYDLKELDILNQKLLDTMNEFVSYTGIDLLVVVFTSISKNGSIIFSAGELTDAVNKAFDICDSNQFIKGVVSRKKQIVPKLSKVIGEYL